LAEQNIKTLDNLTREELIEELKLRDRLINKLLTTNEEQERFINLLNNIKE
jgi:hypothetical protein